MENSYSNIAELEALIAQCDDKREALLLFNENINLLQQHTFIFFGNDISSNTGNRIPEYMNKVEDGICVTTLASEDGCLVLNKEIALQANHQKQVSFYYKFGYVLDVQMMNYLSDYYQGKRSIPKHFISILNRCDKKETALDCAPYLLENGSKISDPKIEAGVCKSYLPFVRFSQSGFEKFSTDYPFDESEYLQLKEVVDLMKNEYMEGDNSLIDTQKLIYCILLKTTIIHFTSRSQIKKKILELLKFVNEEIGLYFERELAICYWFLKDRNDPKICRFFKDIQIGSKKNLMNTLRGMAWDLFHLRWLMTSMYNGKNHEINSNVANNIIYIDSLVTQDKGLINIVQAYPIRCIIYKTGDIMPKIIWKYSIVDIVEEIDVFDDFCSNLETRQQVFRNIRLDLLIKDLEDQLLSIISK